MTYSVGGSIQSVDFNNIIITNTPSVNEIWGVGFSDTGYGQTEIPTVSTGSIVTANPWQAVINSITASALHQGTAITPMTIPVSGNLIAFYAALQGNLLTINNNRLNLATAGTDITSSATRTLPWGYGQGRPVVQSTATVTFASANQARYFFNAGGTVRLTYSRTGGTLNPQDLAWTQLLTDVGTLGLPGGSLPATVAGASYQGLTKFGGGGEAPSPYERRGFYDLADSPTIVFRQSVAGGDVYTNDHLSVFMGEDGTGVLTIISTFTDTVPAINATIDGSLTVNVTVRPPATTYITNTWGTPVINVSAPA
jgi:hypothetical protein